MTDQASSIPVESGYVTVGELRMYYEVQGDGPPLVLLHGGMTSIEMTFGTMRPTLARTRRTVAVEQQGHGHTADLDRPLDFEQMADDTAALLQQLGVGPADVLGYSDGGNVALGLAIRHPDLVRQLIVAGTNFTNDGLNPEILEYYQHARPDDMGSLGDDYAEVAPDPAGWPGLVAKVMAQALAFEGWSREDLEAIAAPTLVICGDADIVRPEHAVELWRLIPDSQLAILPGTDHVAQMVRAERVLPLMEDFLSASADDMIGEPG